jgi:hypothetical protein
MLKPGLFLAHSILAVLPTAAPTPVDADACKTAVLQLLADRIPLERQVWELLTPASQTVLTPIFKCDSAGVPTTLDAITFAHESIHKVDADHSNGFDAPTRAYRLVSGEWITVIPHEDDYTVAHARGQALKSMSISDRTDDGFVKVYLYDLGVQDFFSLLDEMNAYAHQLKTAMVLPAFDGISEQRDGAAAMVVFLLRYLQSMQKQNPDYYESRLFAPEGDYAAVLRGLITQVYSTINESCAISNLGMRDKQWFTALSTPASKTQLTKLFGADKIPVIAPDCVKIAHLMPLKNPKAIPITFPLTAIDPSVGNPSVTEVKNSFKRVILQMPAFAPYDPTKPTIDVRWDRIDDVHIQTSCEWRGETIVNVQGLTPAESYGMWGAKKMTRDELRNLENQDQDLVHRLNNSHDIVGRP